ncbi:hypothetical protein M0811_11040 [Anaeramoeba ignava]|uniref:Rho GDP-dissociation inhibitor n=1 Tax=Anaeramoeba ignava TaxID=1746090 RepID=A0A9Q0R7T9_ANAIG|nr:hypothetical protein M0811_11040 [Anaeramoeba ignava]|eukprot:Anaeramoba_ignava/a483305_560.p1 GENE.a483305_560~~a483305_560.p1  ORF type:complete len:203 (+),score=85.34 a483305_560:16-624(+)
MAQKPKDIPLDERPDDDGFKAPPKVATTELIDKDKDDESLNKWKSSLLGNVKLDEDPNLPHVSIMELRVLIPGRDDIVLHLDKKEEIEKLPKNPFVLKEGTSYRFQLRFKVRREIVVGLKSMTFVYKKGIRVDKSEQMIGSYGPQQDLHSFTYPEDTAPTGMLARGHYKAKSRFIDDDLTNHLEFRYTFDIRKKWPEEEKKK